MKMMRDTDLTGEIYSLLYDLGIKADTVAFFHTAYAACLAAEQPQKLLLVTKWLYPEVARHYHTNWKAVERNIRRTALAIWNHQAGKLEALAGQPLATRPTPTEFLSILSCRLRNERIA